MFSRHFLIFGMKLIAERLSARLWIGDLFSGCVCVCTYVLVMVTNVNWRSCSKCHFVLTPGQDIGYVHYTTMSGRHFLETEEGEDSVAGPSQCTYFAVPSAQTSAEHSWRLATLRETFFYTVLWTPTKRAMTGTCAAHPLSAWRLERRAASYACVVLIYTIVILWKKERVKLNVHDQTVKLLASWHQVNTVHREFLLLK